MPTYTYTTLNDPLGTGSTGLTMYGIPIGGTAAMRISPTAGNIVGVYVSSDSKPHGFLYNGTTYTTRDDPLGTNGTIALGINDSGQVVGTYLGATTGGFLYSGGTYTTLSDPLGALTIALDINNSGNIVGTYIDSNSKEYGFLYSSGTYTTLNDPLGSGKTAALGINTSGQIVGTYLDSSNTQRGFLYSGGTYTTLNDPLGTGGTIPLSINDSGQIVGTYLDSSSKAHGFLYSGSVYTTIDDPLGALGSVATGISNAGQIVGGFEDSSGKLYGFLANPAQTTVVTAQIIQNDYLAITRTPLSSSQATTIVNSINAGTQTETQYVNGLLSQVANTTIPAAAVEASMYSATGTSAEVTSLTVNFLPAQVANATHWGLNAQVYACEALGLVFAFGNENGSMAFSNNFGPSNSAMPNTTTGDAAFAAAASSAIFGSASTANLVNVLGGFISNWKAFYTGHGVPGISSPSTAQIDLAARGAAWGDMVGVALANNLGPLNGQVINFLDDAAQGSAVYGASLVGQPAHQPFQGA